MQAKKNKKKKVMAIDEPTDWSVELHVVDRLIGLRRISSLRI